jgi:hypothetical protein
MTNSDSEFKAKPGKAADPIQRLTWHYENPAAEAMLFAANGIPVVGIASNTIPWELIRAAGAFPCVINSGNAHHPDIPNFMEDAVFEERIRALLGAAISGNPIRAILETYYLDAPSPRIFPFEIADEWFQKESVNGIDGVVFYLPPEDCVAGWDT